MNSKYSAFIMTESKSACTRDGGEVGGASSYKSYQINMSIGSSPVFRRQKKTDLTVY